MKTHELKSWPDFFEPIMTGQKTFELRFNDRNFEVGDVLRLREYDDAVGSYTGRELQRRITFILNGIGPGGIIPIKGLLRGYSILSLADLEGTDLLDDELLSP